ncbi:MAG: EVE domain-containing protein [Prochlorococcus sp.]
MTGLNYWLMKSEPDVYGIEHLKAEGDTLWDGIRNYQARNFMRTMNVGDQAFFYHSNCKPPGIVGMMEVIETGIVDPTQFDPKAKYFDPRSCQDKPRWDCVRLRHLGSFSEMISLDQLRELYSVEEMPVIRRGNRLSILPIPQTSATDLLKRLGPLC